MLLTAGRHVSDDDNEHYAVTLCPRCGQFRVIADRNGEHIFITFELVHEDHLEAARRYIEHLEAEAAKETP